MRAPAACWHQVPCSIHNCCLATHAMLDVLIAAGGLRPRNKALTCNDGWNNASFRG